MIIRALGDAFLRKFELHHTSIKQIIPTMNFLPAAQDRYRITYSVTTHVSACT